MIRDPISESLWFSMALLARVTSLTLCCAVPLLVLAFLVSVWNSIANNSEIKQLRAAVAYYHGGGK